MWERPTYAAFRALLDNYSAETGNEEVVTNSERSEVSNFLQAILETETMKFCMEYCHAKDPDRVSDDPADFERLLRKVGTAVLLRKNCATMDLPKNSFLDICPAVTLWLFITRPVTRFGSNSTAASGVDVWIRQDLNMCSLVK